MEAKNIGEYLGTLQESVSKSWRQHLKTDKYSDHKALNEFYDEALDLVDTLIEDYQGLHGVVDDLKNVMDADDEMSAVEYLEALRDFTRDGREEFIDEDETELASDIDAILSLIDSTLYKLKELKESKATGKSLRDFIYEALNN